MKQKYCVDGVMIGRGVFKNPLVFSKDTKTKNLTKQEKLNMTVTHMRIFEETWHGQKDFNILKKFFKMYIKSFRGANALRQSLMETKNQQEALGLLRG
jgi:tRNA-dihydrouridine synthase